MRTILDKIQALLKRENGQTMAEYAVVLAVIAITVVVALTVLSGAISSALDIVTNQINPPPAP
jgi:Flp pilus assembly pilin Flp